jgi:hypothetical protein
MTAPSILRAAISHMEDRAKTYDKPEGERSMGATVEAFRAVSGVSMTEEQGWLFMALLKAVRTQQGAHKADNYEDGAAYFALAGEAAMRDRMPRNESLDRLREKIKVGEGISFGGGADGLGDRKCVGFLPGGDMPADFGQQNQLQAIADKIKVAGQTMSGDFKSGGFTGQGCLSSSPAGGPLTRCVGCTEQNCMC